MIRAGQALTRAIAFYERGIARIEDRWADGGGSAEQGGSTKQDPPYGRFPADNDDNDDNHPYARDLDIFGHGSLFQLLSLARTHAGEDMLAGWLKAPATVPDLRQQQESVAELRDRLDFREALATTGDAAGDIDTTALTSWATAGPVLTGIRLQAAAVALAIAIIATAAWWSAGGLLCSGRRPAAQSRVRASPPPEGRPRDPRHRTAFAPARRPRGHSSPTSSRSR